MCGIVGVVAERNVIPILLEGLKRLEYRGYDSAGIAYLVRGQLQRTRAVGKVSALVSKVSEIQPNAIIGIAHSRWATHGVPSERNAHPHFSGDELAVVHNGIIENFAELRQELEQQGIEFASDTDTEVIAHMLRLTFAQTGDMLVALQSVVKRLQGAYAIVVLHKQLPNRLYAARLGSPLVVGLGIGENFLASDSLSLLPVTNRFIYLEEGDMVELGRESLKIWNDQGVVVTRAVEEVEQIADAAAKGQYKHYMQKEIFEQPQAIRQTLQANTEPMAKSLEASLLARVKHIRIVACGTSYHAGMVARYWFEKWAGISCDVEIASEIRYRAAVVPESCLFVTVSQSGETADTLAALRQAKALGYLATLAICNVPQSSLVREADMILLTRAGTELGVASTKAFTTQLTAFLMMTRALLQARKQEALAKTITSQLHMLPELVQQVLSLNSQVKVIAEHFVEKHHALFLGRGEFFPIALEGALKLKEISYIHAEAYAAGELKHGPLALIDHDMPVIAIAPDNALLNKLKANLQEVQARGGVLYVFGESQLANQFQDLEYFSALPSPIPELVAPIVYTIPLQLLAYHVAVYRGTDVDQPRNLAKSVTVE